MEEELTYSTVVFKNGGGHPKEKNEDSTIYSTVKTKGTASAEPKIEGEPHKHFCLLVVCVCILCVLLAACISTIISISVVMNKQTETFKANVNNLTAENQQLIMERSVLENKTEELSRDRDDLNWTLNIILKFKYFPVDKYCRDKQCQPCRQGWIHFQGKCYLFYKKSYPWMTWQQSQNYCKDEDADLVVVDSLQEQEFIASHIKFYYDNFHGYWIGLRKNAEGNWTWVDRRSDTLGYWMKTVLGDAGPCALMIPNQNSTANWDPAYCGMYNKFICESDALIRAH
ncbi:asialoglycoprotein receptor 2-like [Echeneis naucrates]|uniref:asialoglycoprotein receptor 2-like n=1 Tax=Echeneis naucrates TaxID=173247 RepID=UPI0011141284|nr:asialoglycoprotein receptor 2-like [Echeneis naucrates]